MTPIRSVFAWILSKLWAVVVVSAVLWLGAFVINKHQELKKQDQTIVQFRSIEAGVNDAAARASTEAQARIKELDQAAQEAVDGRVQTLNKEIKQLSSQLPSPRQRAVAIATGDMKTISDWASKEVTIRVTAAERDVLVRVLDFRSKLGEYERWMREGPAEMERLRLEHVRTLKEIAWLDEKIEQLIMAHWLRVHVYGTREYFELKRLQAERKGKTEHTHALKAKHDELSTFMRTLQKPTLPVTMLQDLKIEPILEELRGASGQLEAKLKQDWFWRVSNFDFITTDLVNAALIIVAVAAAIPVGLKLVFFYVLAPIATRRPAVALLPNSGGLVLTGRDLPEQASVATSSVSCRVTIDSSNELLAHPEYLQSLPNASESRTQWILNRHIPFSSIAAGLCALTHMRAETPQTVVVSSTRDPLSEVSAITIPDGSSAMLLPRHIVGVLQTRSAPLRITRHWRLFSLHAWLTLQLRYLVFHGPVTLVVEGCRGVRVEAAEAGRSLNPAATIGFSANLIYASRRCETLFGYLSGQQPLLKDSFAGGSGYYIYQETPYQRRGGFVGRGFGVLLDAVLKPLGV